jgi:glycosyltransferase involved in cell wall biosynthesis
MSAIPHEKLDRIIQRFATVEHDMSSGAVPGDAFVIGTVSRLAEHKGHDDILDALGGQLKAQPHWRLLWVGDGWWRERLIAKARAMNISVAEPGDTSESASSAQLILTGLVPPQEVPSIMSCMDVLVHASYREGLPRTVPQALLSGVCPVAYDVDGTGEACRELETGRLVPLSDTVRLAQAVAWCAENPVARRALAARGRAECQQRFSAQTMVAALEHVYAKAMGSAL